MSGTFTRQRAAERRGWLREIVVIDALLLTVLAFMWFQSWELQVSSRQFPLWVIGITFILLVGDLAQELRRGRGGATPVEVPPQPQMDAVPGFSQDTIVAASELAEHAAAEQTAAEPEAPSEPGLNQWVILGWLAAVTILMAFLPYYLAVPIFLAAFLMWIRTPLRTVIATAVISALFTYGFFAQLLELR